ncbi:MarR family transcriptional regulator [Halobacteriales archaeon QH_10_70_21]|jgi:DNA-binding transcriptional ArsR family regulator|nr:MAG: MarR family transcriptional regulator [Halobacteriales archaeon QH_10_70_21]
MQAKGEYRDREDTQVAVLDALVERTEEGMTVFELRSDADVDIDELETALADLKQAGLITVENEDEPMRIYPDDRVVPDPDADDDGGRSLLERIRDRLGV